MQDQMAPASSEPQTDGSCRIGRVYPRLLMGGAEVGILHLLEGIDDTHMIVTVLDGPWAERARQLAARYTLCQRPRFADLLGALQGCEIVHIHTINNHLLIPLAAQLAGPRALIQTIHNRLDAEYCHFVDHSIVLGSDTIDRLDTPSQTTVVPNAVRLPDAVAPFGPWHAQDRPLRLVEIRRPDKPMTHTLEALLATGALDDLSIEAQVVGFEQASADPRISYVGPQDDPYPIIQWADVLVHGSKTEAFGRTVYEAMACGAVPVATPLPTFTAVFPPDEGAIKYLAGGEDTLAAARSLRNILQGLKDDPEGHRALRECNHERMADFSIEALASRTEAVYARVLAAPPVRSFGPQDLEPAAAAHFAQLVDDLTEEHPPQRLAEASQLPPRAQAVFMWLQSRYILSQPQQRIVLLRDAIAVLGERPILMLDLGQVLRETEQHQEALAVMRRATELRPFSLAAWVEGIGLLINEGELRLALDWSRRALQALPGCPVLLDAERRLKRAV